MAYNPFGEDTGVEDFSGQAATEEERKKRLARMAALMTGGAGLGDTAGQMLGDRIAPISQAIENPQAALQQRFGEPIQKVQQLQQALQGQQGPVGPVMPEQVAQERQSMLPPGQTQQAQQMPVAPVTPEEVQQTQLPQPGPGVQVAGPAQAVNPATVQQPVAEVQPKAAEISKPALNDVHHDAFIAASNSQDPKERRAAFAALLANPNVPEGLKTQANQAIVTDYQNQRAQQQAMEKLQTATPNDLARYMQEKNKDEGSYLKAILFHRLGLTELAQQEQEKLSPQLKSESATDANGNKYTVQRNKAGDIVKAFNSEGNNASQEEIARLSAAAMPTKAHLLPSVHGSPVQNAQGQTGLLMYDPQTNSSYVQVGNQRLSTAGWTTMAQNVNNVYNASQAQKLGAGAGEGFTPSPMRPLPGQVPQAAQQVVTPGSPEETKKALDRAQGDVAGTDRQIAELSRLPNTDPTKQQRIAILQSEKAAAQQRVQQLSGAVQGLPQQAQAAAVPGGGIAQQKANLAIQEAQQKEGIQVAGARSQAFNKILDEEIRPQAQNGDTIVSTRKQQFAIFDRPGVDASKIFGIANGAGQSPNDQRWTMLRDTLLGKTTATDDQIRERAAQLGLNREEQAALAEYNIANAKINAATLKQTAGAGSVSDAEQRANREMNVDPTKIPGLGAYNAMAQSQFSGDLARYKADWASTHPATNALQLDKAWRKESQQLTEMYANIAKERAKFITDNGATTPAVKEAYKRYPVPEYDPATEKWKKTKPLTAYER